MSGNYLTTCQESFLGRGKILAPKEQFSKYACGKCLCFWISAEYHTVNLSFKKLLSLYIDSRNVPCLKELIQPQNSAMPTSKKTLSVFCSLNTSQTITERFLRWLHLQLLSCQPFTRLGYFIYQRKRFLFI